MSQAHEAHEEPLNVYDTDGRCVGVRPRAQAKASGLAVGAVNVLLVRADGRVLLQRRPADKENGGRWDKSVGGHVGAGESFDDTVQREAGEELFDDPGSSRVHLWATGGTAPDVALGAHVVILPLATHLNLRDVRLDPAGGIRNVVYHVGIYAGRTEIPEGGFRPQASEIDDLRYFPPAEIDRMLVGGELAPNMAFLWLAYGGRVLGLAGRGTGDG